MPGEKDLKRLLKTMKPKHNSGDYVFCVVENTSILKMDDIIFRDFFLKEVVHYFIFQGTGGKYSCHQKRIG